MGVFGSSDSSQGKKLEADVEFIKTRLDLIAKQVSSGAAGGDQNLDAKLKAIYDAVRAIRISQAAPPQSPAPTRPDQVRTESLDEIRADIKQLLGKSDRTTHLELTQRLDAIESELKQQQETTKALAAAIRELLGAIKDR